MEAEVQLLKNGKRLDGRSPSELRKPLEIRLGVLDRADGSAYIRWGGNKIVVGVFGPKEALPKHIADPTRAILRVYYTMAPFSSIEEHGKLGISRRSVELSKVIREALESIILLDQYPETMIDIFISVLQAEGGTRVASITAATAALMDAGIPLCCLAAGISAGKAAGRVLLDLSKEEDNYGQADLPVAFSSKGEILLLQMDGMMTRKELEEGINLVEQGVNYLFKKLREAVIKKYEGEIEKKLRLI